MKSHSTQILIRMIAGLVFLFLIACATPGPVGPVPDKGLLDFLEDGKTTRQIAYEMLGKPSGNFETGKILTYRIGSEEGKGYYIADAGTSGQVSYKKSKHSLVLIFNNNGILKKHSLVNVR